MPAHHQLKAAPEPGAHQAHFTVIGTVWESGDRTALAAFPGHITPLATGYDDYQHAFIAHVQSADENEALVIAEDHPDFDVA
ncbi:hypothetical protein RCO28_20720 [Streptomyces sp. LHD-70]|uniref:hypothetical protein n=1 Tax=Streptomyces sp. LHD-70 TaxID=3072140 RepID=UPI00280D3C3A|nr:hypothetical protein [Streptomyces sp. LHD-70]MDQ8704897.1 hypothetical protein [Streptomyces sp. LHD-70]